MMSSFYKNIVVFVVKIEGISKLQGGSVSPEWLANAAFAS